MNFEEMYRDYIMCDRKCELLLDEKGYAEYQILGTELCIGAIYLKPQYRGIGISHDCPFGQIFNKVLTIAKERGCVSQVHYLPHSNPAKDRIIKYLIFHGMKLSHNDGNTMVFYKEI